MDANIFLELKSVSSRSYCSWLITSTSFLRKVLCLLNLDDFLPHFHLAPAVSAFSGTICFSACGSETDGASEPSPRKNHLIPCY